MDPLQRDPETAAARYDAALEEAAKLVEGRSGDNGAAYIAEQIRALKSTAQKPAGV